MASHGMGGYENECVMKEAVRKEKMKRDQTIREEDSGLVCT